MKGWGPKSSVCPSKPGKSNFFGGISRDFAGISWRCPKIRYRRNIRLEFLDKWQVDLVGITLQGLRLRACFYGEGDSEGEKEVLSA